MKTRACNIDFSIVPLQELNKALAFYYGKSAYITAENGGTLHYHLDIDDDVINHLLEMSKSSHANKLIDHIPQHTPSCCQIHSFTEIDVELENGTLIFDQYSSECIHLIKQIYIQMAEYYFSTHHLSVPNVIETRFLQTAGYFEKFPTQAMLCATLPLEPIRVKDFVARYQNDPLHALEFFSDKKYALNPVTCYHIYSNFSKLQHKYSSYRYTIEGKAHRYEGKNSEAGRLIEFHMAEIVLIENESDHIQINELIQFYKHFFFLLNIPVEFQTSSDAFFTVDAKLHAQLQERTASKIELICPLTHTNFALGSINTHHDYFVKRFDLAKNGAISTKCTGIGIERLLIALYSYHPNNVKELLTHVYSSLDQECSDYRRTKCAGRAM